MTMTKASASPGIHEISTAPVCQIRDAPRAGARPPRRLMSVALRQTRQDALAQGLPSALLGTIRLAQARVVKDIDEMPVTLVPRH